MPQQQYTKEELESRFRKLPPVLQEALFSVEVADNIFETGRKYGLETRKISLLAEETGYVILGLTQPREFLSKLSEALEINADKARDITKEINHRIFFPLREELKKTHQIDVSDEGIAKAEPLVRMPEGRQEEGAMRHEVRIMNQGVTAPPKASIPAPSAPPTPVATKPTGVPGVILPPSTRTDADRPPTVVGGRGQPRTVPKPMPPTTPPPQGGKEGLSEKVIEIPKIPQREPLIPPELATSPKIPPINLRAPTAADRPPAEGRGQTRTATTPITPTTPSSLKPMPPTPPPTKPTAPPPPPPTKEPEEKKPQARPVEPAEGKPRAGFDPYREPPGQG